MHLAIHFAIPILLQPAPPWEAMDYGPFLSASIEIDASEVVCKAIAVPLGAPGGESMLFDTDLLRWACGWRGDFIELRGIVYDGPHGIVPRIDGELDWRNPPLPGVTASGVFDDPRPLPFGPLPRERARWRGVLVHGDDVALSYRVGATEILDAPRVIEIDGVTAYARTIEFDGADERVLVRAFGGEPPLRAGVVPAGDVSAAIIEQDGDVCVQVEPSSGPGRIEILVARADASRFRKILAGRPPPAPLTRFRQGGRSRWTSHPTLPGVLDVRFDGRGARRIVRAAGDPPHRIELPETAGARAVQVDAKAIVFEPPAGTPAPPLAAFDCDRGEGAHELDTVRGDRSLRLDGVTWRRGLRGRSLDFDGTACAEWEGGDLDPIADDYSVAAWIHCSKDGTIVSRTEREGPWVPHGWTFFVRDGRLAFDVGWVGVVEGERDVTDSAWHHVAFTRSAATGLVRIYLDGEPEASGTLPVDASLDASVVRLGFTAPDFPASPWFSGYMDGIRLYDRVLDAGSIRAAAGESGEPIVTAWGLRGRLPGARWTVDGARATLELPAATATARADLVRWRGRRGELPAFLATLEMPPAARPFAIDELSWPKENAYRSWLRFGSFDFLDPDSVAITTWSGDVWRVDGLDEDLDAIRWQRLATGLNQPLGLVVRDGEILVLGRHQITRLDDLNGDGETDRYACFHDLMLNSEHFHEPCTGLQVGDRGELYYMKAARHAKDAIHSQHGTLIRVAADGSAAEILASGFRAPNGLLVDGGGTFIGSDQEGHWMPANRINVIRPGGFYGNNWSGTGAPRETHDPPLCWVHNSVDRSPSSQVRVPPGTWGDLGGGLLGLSYGTGRVYRILEDEVDGVRQGGIVPLPIEVPTGIMTGRFNPADGNLYLCGLFGWSSNATQPGGFYRVRMAGRTPFMPEHVRATRDGLRLRFNRAVDADSVHAAGAFAVEAWAYEWTERYGSPQIDRRTWPIRATGVAPDGRTVQLDLDGIEPAMQVHLTYRMRSREGDTAESYVHMTVHALADE